MSPDTSWSERRSCKTEADCAPACADASARRRGALEQAIEEAREYRREASSRIVVPDGAGGALPGGGKIKL